MLRVTSRITLALALLLVAAPGSDAFAQSRSEVIRWQGNDVSDTDGYVVHYGSASRTYSDSVDVGIPAVVDGAFEYSITVAAEADVYIAVSAYNEHGASVFSNENCKGPGGVCGGDPPADPPPPPPAVESQIVGFKLWDAATDTVIDPSFVSGDQIDALAYPCVAIEIMGNAYLAAGGPGSVHKSFDGQNVNSCGDPGVTHENSEPYAWETDTGPDRFECAASLTVAGTHSLTVTPFDGDNCSGAEGSPVTIQFDVIHESTTEPPPDEGLGQPGKPFLVL